MLDNQTIQQGQRCDFSVGVESLHSLSNTATELTSASIVSAADQLRSVPTGSRRVLFISYAFPPTGGAGVQRAVKFVKYLPSFGWLPTVLTVSNPSMPMLDSNLIRDIAPQTNIVRARTMEPNYTFKRALANTSIAAPNVKRNALAMLKRGLRRIATSILLPDPQILWNGSAYRAAVKALKQHQHAAIFVTAPPFSSLLLGEKLKQRFGLPLILDFRDEWLLASRYLENYQIGRWGLRRHEALLHRVLKSADAVVATTPSSAQELAGHCRKVGSQAVCRCIFNGFDPDDFASLASTNQTTPQADRKENRLRIVYTGTLWRLTDIGPMVSALELLSLANPRAGKLIELVLIGRRTTEQDQLLRRLDKTCIHLKCHDYLPHDQALSVAASADCLLLTLADEPGAERVISAKLFEYLAMHNRILSIVPHGDTRKILMQCGAADIFSPTETQGIADWLLTTADRRTVTANPRATSLDLTRYSRPYLTDELAQLLSNCTTTRKYALHEKEIGRGV